MTHRAWIMATACTVLSAAAGIACAGARGPDDIGPTLRVGVYDIEVPNLAIEAMLVVNEPTEAYVRDSLWVHHGDVFECRPLLRLGRTGCGGFSFKSAGSEIMATYRHCEPKEVQTTRTVRDPTTGQVRDETTFSQTQDCRDFDVKVTRRSIGGAQGEGVRISIACTGRARPAES